MRVAIVGANGFLGRNLATHLHLSGYEVRSIVREAASGVPETTDLRRYTSKPGPGHFENVDVVVNCAGRAHVLKHEKESVALKKFIAANADLPVAIAQAAQAAGVRKLVHMSSVAAISSHPGEGKLVDDSFKPNPTTPYGRSKLQGDTVLDAISSAQFPIACLRPPAIYGPGVGGWFSHLAMAARMGMPLPLGHIENARSFAYVGNICSAVELALTAPITGSFIVTDSPPLSTADFYTMLCAASKRQARIWNWPPGLIKLLAGAILGARANSLLGSAAYCGKRFALATGWEIPTTPELATKLTMAGRSS